MRAAATPTLTAFTRRSAQDYIDDVAMESSEAEGEYQHAPRARRPLTSPKDYTDASDIQNDEEDMDDPDSAEAQARAHDYRAYNMPAILEGHEARIRAPERYRVPKALLAPRAAPPPRAPTPPTASTSQVTHDPRLRGRIYRPEPPPRPVAPAARPQTPLFLLESREASPSEPDDSQPVASLPRPSPSPTSHPVPRFSLHEHVHGKRPRPPSPIPESSEPPPKRRQLEETARLRNFFLVDNDDAEESCDEKEDFGHVGKQLFPLD